MRLPETAASLPGGGHREEAHLQRGPAPGAVAALQAAEELGVPGLVGVHVEAQVLVGQEAGAANPAQVRPHQRLGGLIAVPVGRRRGGCHRQGAQPEASFRSHPASRLRPMYLRYFLPRNRWEGRPRRRGSASGSLWEDGSLFSESDWLTATSARRLAPRGAELATSELCGSPCRSHDEGAAGSTSPPAEGRTQPWECVESQVSQAAAAANDEREGEGLPATPGDAHRILY